VPGAQYRVHTVTAQGLTPDAQQDFDRGWRMKPGDVYNESYVADFLHSNTALQRLNGYSAGFQASADPQTHLVDLTITFVGADSGR
jgi:outer membrane protein insertion porin family